MEGGAHRAGGGSRQQPLAECPRSFLESIPSPIPPAAPNSLGYVVTREHVEEMRRLEKLFEAKEEHLNKKYKPVFLPVDDYLSKEINCELINVDIRSYPWKNTPFGDVYYSPRYTDDRYTYRHVILTNGVRKEAERVAATVPGGLLTEEVFVHYLGIVLSSGWSHFMLFNKQYKELILRRPKEPETSTAARQPASRIRDGAPGPADEVDSDSGDDAEQRAAIAALRSAEMKKNATHDQQQQQQQQQQEEHAAAAAADQGPVSSAACSGDGERGSSKLKPDTQPAAAAAAAADSVPSQEEPTQPQGVEKENKGEPSNAAAKPADPAPPAAAAVGGGGGGSDSKLAAAPPLGRYAKRGPAAGRGGGPAVPSGPLRATRHATSSGAPPRWAGGGSRSTKLSAHAASMQPAAKSASAAPGAAARREPTTTTTAAAAAAPSSTAEGQEAATCTDGKAAGGPQRQQPKGGGVGGRRAAGGNQKNGGAGVRTRAAAGERPSNATGEAAKKRPLSNPSGGSLSTQERPRGRQRCA
ncbi:hypothetical protein Efla_002157 [Eimeria flavescens]